MVAWVASPVIGGLTTAAIHAFICYAVHERSAPVAAAATLQPLLVMLTVTVAAAFLIVSGPAVLRVEPLSRGIAASAAFGLAVALTTLAAQRLVVSSGTVHGSTGASWRHDRPGGDAISQEAGDTESCLRSSSTAPSEWREEGERAPPPLGTAGTAGAAGTAAATAANGPDVIDGLKSPDGAQQHAGEERPFVALLVLSALTVAFAHGANDLGNSIGPLAALLVVERGGDILARPTIPPWVLGLGACGFVVGIVLLGSRTITTVGSKITRLTPSRSFAVQMGTAIAVLSSTVLGLAVSTSHCLVGAIIGVGVVDKARGRKDAELNMSTILKIVIGWATTIPLAMAVSVGVFAALSGMYAGQCAAPLPRLLRSLLESEMAATSSSHTTRCEYGDGGRCVGCACRRCAARLLYTCGRI